MLSNIQATGYGVFMCIHSIQIRQIKLNLYKRIDANEFISKENPKDTSAANGCFTADPSSDSQRDKAL